MNKVRVSTHSVAYPMPVVIVGAMVDGKPNFQTVAWMSRVNYTPPMIGISLGKTHHTTKGIHAHGEFSVNLPGPSLLAVTDYVGMVSGEKVDKSRLFETFTGELPNAPMIQQCPLTIECRVNNIVNLGDDEVFIGDVVTIYADEAVTVDGAPDITKIDPILFTMPDNRYWSLGKPLGDAWSVGRDYQA